MQCEAVVAEDSEGFVVVAIHVAREKIEHRHVHEIEQSSIFVVRRDLPHQRTIVGVYGISSERSTIPLICG